jgi:oligopeptide/dipeptide ABC transporter ATP-binding protein
MSFLELKNIKKFFPVKRGFLQRTVSHVRAVDGVSIAMEKFKNLGIVGESGCGKSTLARIIVKLIEPDSGSVIFQGQDITSFSYNQMRPFRQRMQIIFQDPFNSLDPRFTISDIIKEAFISLDAASAISDKDKQIEEIINVVGLPSDCLSRYPYEFSGGERQRIAIARALIRKPQFLIFDEAVSSLDVILQMQILDLLNELQDKFGLTYLFISHSLRVIKKMAKEVAIMYLGRIVEIAQTGMIFSGSFHPYTKALLAAAVDFKVALKGEPPLGIDIPSGCRFHTRCPYREKICMEVEPRLKEMQPGHFVACHFPLAR